MLRFLIGGERGNQGRGRSVLSTSFGEEGEEFKIEEEKRIIFHRCLNH